MIVGRRKIRVALLYGGRSAEHPVSVVSARSVIEALDPERFEVVPIGITREGAWMLPRTSPLELTAPEGGLPEVEEDGAGIALRPEQRAGAIALAAGGEQIGEIDVVLPILHGPYGEDGTVQGLFELADLPYVGAGVLASALAMDKSMAKVVLAQAGIAQAPYLVVREREWLADPEAVAARVAGALRYPVFTKPARLGSSIGISKVKSPGELAAAL
ncbi:MAG TPA: D-alanine--D-alanine ligase A, partial [Actinomycetota bacterium]